MIADAVLFLHVLTVVFMAAPLYNLIIVNERLRFGAAPASVDRYLETILRGAARRCYVFQATALVTGVALLPLSGMPWSALYRNPLLLAKLLLLLGLAGLLSVVVLRLQPAIDRALADVAGEEIPEEIRLRLAPPRAARKRLAAVCLFLVITAVLLGVQLRMGFDPFLSGAVLALAAVFAWRAYASPLPHGWI